MSFGLSNRMADGRGGYGVEIESIIEGNQQLQWRCWCQSGQSRAVRKLPALSAVGVTSFNRTTHVSKQIIEQRLLLNQTLNARGRLKRTKNKPESVVLDSVHLQGARLKLFQVITDSVSTMCFPLCQRIR